MSNGIKAIGIFGGTFDPIHLGHLRTALEIYEQLPLQEIRFLPCQQPVHKVTTTAPASHRLAMLKLAIENQPGFSIDTRELERATPSYMYESLLSIRQEVGNIPLCLICSMDAFTSFTRWYRWQELLELAHLVVANRAGHAAPKANQLDSFFVTRYCKDPKRLVEQAAGSLFFVETTSLAISSTLIREVIKAKLSARYLLPDAIYHYLLKHQLYT